MFSFKSDQIVCIFKIFCKSLAVWMIFILRFHMILLNMIESKIWILFSVYIFRCNLNVPSYAYTALFV